MRHDNSYGAVGWSANQPSAAGAWALRRGAHEGGRIALPAPFFGVFFIALPGLRLLPEVYQIYS